MTGEERALSFITCAAKCKRVLAVSCPKCCEMDYFIFKKEILFISERRNASRLYSHGMDKPPFLFCLKSSRCQSQPTAVPPSQRPGRFLKNTRQSLSPQQSRAHCLCTGSFCHLSQPQLTLSHHLRVPGGPHWNRGPGKGRCSRLRLRQVWLPKGAATLPGDGWPLPVPAMASPKRSSVAGERWLEELMVL